MIVRCNKDIEFSQESLLTMIRRTKAWESWRRCVSQRSQDCRSDHRPVLRSSQYRWEVVDVAGYVVVVLPTIRRTQGWGSRGEGCVSRASLLPLSPPLRVTVSQATSYAAGSTRR